MESHRRLTNLQQAPSASLLKSGAGSSAEKLWKSIPGNVQELLQLGAGSAGLGASAAGLVGLYNYLSATDKPSSRQPNLVRVSNRKKKKKQREEEEEPVSDELSLSKAAEGYSLFEAAHPALAITTAGASGVAGWKAVEWLLKKMRKQQRSVELENAKENYEEALREQYGTKEGTSSTYASLDTVYEMYVKEAQGVGGARGGIFSDIWGGVKKLPGAIMDNPLFKEYYKWGLITPAVLAALGTGYISYSNRQERSRRKALSEAHRRRDLELAIRRPTRFVAELEEEEEDE